MNKPINILHIMPHIGTGGAEHQLLELIRHADPAVVCHRVFYYSDALDEAMLRQYESAGVSVVRVPRRSKRPVRFLRDFSRAIRQVQPDIVHCWLVSGNFWGRLAAILAGVRVIVVAWRSSQVWNAKGLWLLERFTKNRVCHTVNSLACSHHIGRLIGRSPEAFEVIYNGINLDKYQKTAERDSVFADLHIRSENKIVTMVGRLTDAKNYPMLLQIAALCKKLQVPVRFMIAGHGEQEAVLKDLSDELGLDGMVYFLGVRQDVPQILAASDIFCFTSDWEGFPNALLEAMAAGLPVICTDFDGARELVTGPEVGTVIGRNDIKAACKAIQHYLNNPVEASETGKRARQFVQAKFSMSVMIQKTIQFYQNLLQ